MGKALYDAVTTRIIDMLEAGVKPWQTPWATDHGSDIGLIPCNATTGRAYHGINILLLWCEAHAKGYPRHGWMTFQQANAMGARIRKGEKACMVVYTNSREVETTNDKGDKELKKVPFLKSYFVFNLAQLDNLPAAYNLPSVAPEGDERLDALKDLVTASGIPVKYGFNKAVYSVASDEVFLPSYGSFASDESFASTLSHELAHATGHPNRLNRKFGKRFGDAEYAFEELVAEMASAFTCARLGFEHERESASYLASWLKVLKADNQAIITAASYASKAADWLHERENVVQPGDPDEQARTKSELAREMDDEIAY